MDYLPFDLPDFDAVIWTNAVHVIYNLLDDFCTDSFLFSCCLFYCYARMQPPLLLQFWRRIYVGGFSWVATIILCQGRKLWTWLIKVGNSVGSLRVLQVLLVPSVRDWTIQEPVKKLDGSQNTLALPNFLKNCNFNQDKMVLVLSKATWLLKTSSSGLLPFIFLSVSFPVCVPAHVCCRGGGIGE